MTVQFHNFENVVDKSSSDIHVFRAKKKIKYIYFDDNHLVAFFFHSSPFQFDSITRASIEYIMDSENFDRGNEINDDWIIFILCHFIRRSFGGKDTLKSLTYADNGKCEHGYCVATR